MRVLDLTKITGPPCGDARGHDRVLVTAAHYDKWQADLKVLMEREAQHRLRADALERQLDSQEPPDTAELVRRYRNRLKPETLEDLLAQVQREA